MKMCQNIRCYIVITIIVMFVLSDQSCLSMTTEAKQHLKLKVIEMFNHAYGSYMDHAFPADELMPLSCKGRYRGSEPSRGDVDDSLGNFTLTLIDSLDTLAIMGDIPKFDKAVRLVIQHAKFDTDVIVSVFETNIRVLGGLLGGHVMAEYIKKRKQGMEWYKDELLSMAKDIGTRLLPAFDTPTGMPYPRINLRKGVDTYIGQNFRDTCTACAGTMILEFAALSRLTGDKVFEEKAHKAMDYLWNQRHRSSDLVGTVINIFNGDWIRRESGAGAGIDSYYEYALKAYILLGDDTYLTRFNKHYDAVMKYISQGPVFLDVHMHRPLATSRNFMDALLAFWPGLQVLKGDIQPAIEMHEMFYQVMQRHKFLPEAFTSDFHIHWGHHPLRPEFVESTYFLFKATGDHHYLDVGRKVIENLDRHARVACGFAALKDVTQGTHEDQMDSFVLAETFKYLYLLYADKSDLLFDVDDYIFTTEGHLLPLSLSRCNMSRTPAMRLSREMYSSLQSIEEESKTVDEYGDSEHNTCPNPQVKYKQSLNYAHNMRQGLKDMMGKSNVPTQSEPQCVGPRGNQHRLKAVDFVAGNKDQLQLLKDMGIRLITMTDGRIQLLHTATEALTTQLAEDGLRFMQEMIELSKTQPQIEVQMAKKSKTQSRRHRHRNQETQAQNEPLMLQVVTPPYNEHLFRAGPAQFGYDLRTRPSQFGKLALATPFKVCNPVQNADEVKGKIAILERGDCMFVDKARHLQKAGAIGGIVLDHTPDSSSDNQALFAMSGDGNDNVYIPMLFLFKKEGQILLDMLSKEPNLEVVMAARVEMFDSPNGPRTQTADQSVDSITTEMPEAIAKSQKWPSSDPQGEIPVELPPSQEVGAEGDLTLNTGSQNLKMKVETVSTTSRPSAPTVLDSNVMQIRTMADGTKQLAFKLDVLKGEGKEIPSLNKIFMELQNTLWGRTNIQMLPRRTEYLSAILKMLESAYYGTSVVDPVSKDLFEELSRELEIIDGDEVVVEQRIESAQHIPGSHAAKTDPAPPLPEVIEIQTETVDTSNDGDSIQTSYAGVEDFEEAPVDGFKVREDDDDYKLLKDVNPELAAGLKKAVENTAAEDGLTDTGKGEDKQTRGEKKVEVIKKTYEKTVKNLKSFQDKNSNSIKTADSESTTSEYTYDGNTSREEGEL